VSLLAAVVLALLGALGTVWIAWLRREHERDVSALAGELAACTAELAALRASVESLRFQVVALRGTATATQTELSNFVHGPPSLRHPFQ